jgi:L-ascorbate metabolism protein UlaG (beta-lactamase superfamily)
MNIIKFDQSSFVIDVNHHKLLIDPVEYTHKFPTGYDALDAIVVTHKHSDHFNPELLGRIIEKNPDVQIFTTADTAGDIAGAKIVKSGDKVQVGEFNLEFFGEDHTPIEADIVPCQNIGVIVNDVFVHPGDSFDTPPVEAKVLAVPVSAPWLKTYESMQYITKLKPATAIPIHDALFSELGMKINNNWVQKACNETGVNYVVLQSGENLEI